MKTYKRLKAEEREIISQMVVQGKTCASIARELQRCRSSISRELHVSCCAGKPYRAFQAQREAETRASQRHRHRKLDYPKLWNFVREKLTLRWSP